MKLVRVCHHLHRNVRCCFGVGHIPRDCDAVGQNLGVVIYKLLIERRWFDRAICVMAALVLVLDVVSGVLQQCVALRCVECGKQACGAVRHVAGWVGAAQLDSAGWIACCN